MHPQHPQIYDDDAISAVPSIPLDQEESQFAMPSIEDPDGPIPVSGQPELKHPQPQYALDNPVTMYQQDMRYANTPELTQHHSYASSVGGDSYVDDASSVAGGSYTSPYLRNAMLNRPPTSMGHRSASDPILAAPHGHHQGHGHGHGDHDDPCISMSEIQPQHHNDTASQYDAVVSSVHHTPYGSPMPSRAGTPAYDSIARTSSPYQPINRYPTPAPSFNGYLQRSYSDDVQLSRDPMMDGRYRSTSPFNGSMRPRTHYRSDSMSSVNSSPLRNGRTSAPTAAFPCPLAPYGCSSSFGSKNEWKRHVSTQHLRTDMWRCDQCNTGNNRHNDFNRKDLFIQHLRRMHHPKGPDVLGPAKPVNALGVTGISKRSRATTLEETDPLLVEAERRCHIVIRSPPNESGCLFCPARFSGAGSWEERTEHIGRHLEMNKKECRAIPAVQDWNHDEAVEEWLEAEGLIIQMGYGWQISDGRNVARARMG